jgi:excisionase family DNA binding protein
MVEHPNRVKGQSAGATGDDPLGDLDSLRLLTPGEVAALLHVDANTVARWSNEGRLRAIRTPGGHRRYPASEVLRLARNNGSAGTEQRRGMPPELQGGTNPDRQNGRPVEPRNGQPSPPADGRTAQPRNGQAAVQPQNRRMPRPRSAGPR